jgi:hypothetical protein
MRLLRLADVEIGPNDQVFRHPRLPALILWLGGFAAVAALLFKAYTGAFKPGYIFGPFLSLFLLLGLRFVTARFHPSNWLARINQTGMYVQYRSYLNYRLPADDPSVVFLSYGESASARLVREKVETPDPMHNSSTRQYLRYIELELTGDTTALANALDSERSEQAPMEKHLYGSSATLNRDSPGHHDGAVFANTLERGARSEEALGDAAPVRGARRPDFPEGRFHPPAVSQSRSPAGKAT